MQKKYWNFSFLHFLSFQYSNISFVFLGENFWKFNHEILISKWAMIPTKNFCSLITLIWAQTFHVDLYGRSNFCIFHIALITMNTCTYGRRAMSATWHVWLPSSSNISLLHLTKIIVYFSELTISMKRWVLVISIVV